MGVTKEGVLTEAGSIINSGIYVHMKLDWTKTRLSEKNTCMYVHKDLPFDPGIPPLP